jgi:AcrR family transcriptional regulator
MKVADDGKGTRPYRKTARAETERATGEAILDAAFASFAHEPYDRVTLQSIAQESGVTVQTVIRRFESKEGLFEALVEREMPRILASRESADGEGLAAALRALLEHYETDGDTVLNFLAQEHEVTHVRNVVEQGRRIHREWIERHCAHVLDAAGDDRDITLNAAIAATDLYTWKLLRRDRGLEVQEVHAVMMRMLNGLHGRN